MKRLATCCLLGLVTLAAAARMGARREEPYDIPIIPSAQVLRWISLGHPTLAANLMWLRVVQYVGEPAGNRRGWDRLYPATDVVTTLDPGHGYAYQVAGTLLGSLGRVDESNAILEKGIRNVPDRYILPFLRAFNAFYYQGDYARAGEFVEIAARTPNAPRHLRQNVLAMYVKGGRAEAALRFLEHVRDEAQDEDTRRAVEEQIEQARIEQVAEGLDRALAAHRERYWFNPLTLQQLVHERLVPRVPDDPAGGVFVVGDDGRVHSTAHPFRFAPPRRPEEQRREPGVATRNEP